MDLKSIGIENSDRIVELVVTYGSKIFLSLLVLIIGFWVIAIIGRALGFAMGKKEIDASLQGYLVKIATVILKIGLIISVASMVGIETTSFVAILGAAGLAIGFALQGSLANFAGGVLLLLLRPFKIGDYIQAQGEEGEVTAIDVFCTTLLTLDNLVVIIPNGPLAGEKMVNLTKEENRRVDLAIGISYSDDIGKAIQVLLESTKNDARILNESGPHAPFVGVTEYGDSSINLTFRVWCKTDDYWDVFFDTNKSIKETLDQAKISIPFPQRDVHMINEK